MNKPSLGFFGIVMFGLLFTGCRNPTDSARELVSSLIYGFEDGDPQITLNVNGTSVTIEVVTYGNTCREKGELRVSVSRETRTLSVSPFDWHSSEYPCEDILLEFDHSTTVDLEEAGLWTVVLFGQDINRESVQFEYSVDLGNEGLPPAL